MKVWHAGWFRSKSDRNMLDRTGIWRGAQGGHHVEERHRISTRKTLFDSVGIRMDVSADADAIDCAYKLVEHGGEGCMSSPPAKQDARHPQNRTSGTICKVPCSTRGLRYGALAATSILPFLEASAHPGDMAACPIDLPTNGAAP